MNRNSWGYTIGSLLGGVILAGALLVGIQKLSVETTKVTNHEHVITTSGGMQVKLGKVTAELAQTNIDVGSGINKTVGLTAAPAAIDQLFREAGGDTTSLLTGNMTVCLASVVAYNSQLSGVVSTTILRECRNFVPGQMVGTIMTFAEEYTERVKTLYETKFTFINKGSK